MFEVPVESVETLCKFGDVRGISESHHAVVGGWCGDTVFAESVEYDFDRKGMKLMKLMELLVALDKTIHKVVTPSVLSLVGATFAIRRGPASM